MTSEKTTTKRHFLKSLTAGALLGGFATNTAGKAGEKLGEKVMNTVLSQEESYNPSREAMEFLFGKSADAPSIYAGAGNIIERSEGGTSISPYLKRSASRFTNYIGRALNVRINTVPDNSGPEFDHTYNNNALFLGGPLADTVTREAFGYDSIEVDVKGQMVSMPIPDRTDLRTRWVFLVGEQNYGTYEGAAKKVWRYDKGDLVERPVYRLLDKYKGEVIHPSVHDDLLAGEWLTVYRTARSGTFQVIVAGMHGYSTDAFSSAITENVRRLRGIAGRSEQYQALIPVQLKHHRHGAGKGVTEGVLNWDHAQIYRPD
jgi:hypothetical protein